VREPAPAEQRDFFFLNDVILYASRSLATLIAGFSPISLLLAQLMLRVSRRAFLRPSVTVIALAVLASQ